MSDLTATVRFSDIPEVVAQLVEASDEIVRLRTQLAEARATEERLRSELYPQTYREAVERCDEARALLRECRPAVSLWLQHVSLAQREGSAGVWAALLARLDAALGGER